MELIWGLRRLLAARDILKRQEIRCRIVSVNPIVQGEFTENLLRTERVAIVEALRGYAQGGQRRNCDLDRLTTKEAAGRVGFCRDDYYRAKKVIERGVPELVQAMDQDRISISAADEIAGAEPEVQRAVVARGEREAAWAAREVRRESRRMHGRLSGPGRSTPPLGRPWTITSDQTVLPCDAVITDPPFGVTTKEWDRDVERTTRALGLGLERIRGPFHLHVLLASPPVRGPTLARRVADKLRVRTTSGRIVPNYNLRFATPGEFQRNWDVLLLFRRKNSQRRVNPSHAPWTNGFAELAAMSFTYPQSNFADPIGRSIHFRSRSAACGGWWGTSPSRAISWSIRSPAAERPE
jgi:hypothetical protein